MTDLIRVEVPESLVERLDKLKGEALSYQKLLASAGLSVDSLKQVVLAKVFFTPGNKNHRIYFKGSQGDLSLHQVKGLIFKSYGPIGKGEPDWQEFLEYLSRYFEGLFEMTGVKNDSYSISRATQLWRVFAIGGKSYRIEKTFDDFCPSRLGEGDKHGLSHPAVEDGQNQQIKPGQTQGVSDSE